MTLCHCGFTVDGCSLLAKEPTSAFGMEASNMLPGWLAAHRNAVPVVDSLSVPRRPTGGDPETQRLRTVTHLYGRTEVLAHIGLNADETYMLIDKTNPHALHELMMMSAGHPVRSGLHQHSPAFGTAFGAIANCWVGHCLDNGLQPLVAWSYDPDTEDRETIQGEKRWHAHLMARTPAEMDAIALRAVPAGLVPHKRRRRIAEEASVLAALLAHDCLHATRLETMEPTPFLERPSSTAALRLRLAEGWASLARSAFHADVRVLHELMQTLYDRILGGCFQGKAACWQRARLVNRDPAAVDLPLSRRSRDALGHYLAALYSTMVADADGLRNDRERVTHTYPLAGLAYSMCISEEEGSVYMYMRANVFSDLGGAGVAVVEGKLVKISKGTGILSQDELAARKLFQRHYLTRLRKDRLGDRALFTAKPGAP